MQNNKMKKMRKYKSRYIKYKNNQMKLKNKLRKAVKKSINCG